VTCTAGQSSRHSGLSEVSELHSDGSPRLTRWSGRWRHSGLSQLESCWAGRCTRRGAASANWSPTARLARRSVCAKLACATLPSAAFRVGEAASSTNSVGRTRELSRACVLTLRESELTCTSTGQVPDPRDSLSA